MEMEMKMRVTISKGPQNKWQLTGDFAQSQALSPPPPPKTINLRDQEK